MLVSQYSPHTHNYILSLCMWMHVSNNHAGVSSCTNGDFELIQDPADTRIVGYVQYCFRGEWGRVCREKGFITLWDVSEAVVACRQLGYRSTGEIIAIYTK